MKYWRRLLITASGDYLDGMLHSQLTSLRTSLKIRVPTGAGTSRTIFPVTFSAGPIESGSSSFSGKHEYVATVAILFAVVPFGVMNSQLWLLSE